MARKTELRVMSTGELRSRIPALERDAKSSVVGVRNSARSDLTRINAILDERASAKARANQMNGRSEEAWAKVTELEQQLADARTEAETADREARDALRVMFGQ